MAANLASHFGPWTAMPVVSYTSGLMKQYTAAIYIGSTYGEPIPNAFLDDVFGTTTPVIWAYDNVWQLTARYPNFQSVYGWNWSGFDYSSVAEVDYKGQQLKRYAANAAGIMNYPAVNANVTVLANCVRSDGTTFPWALRSASPQGGLGSLTYIGENPLAYLTEGDRYLAFCDFLFDALAPGTATQHRAFVRLEDIDPTYDPATLRNIANYLASEGVPFGFQIEPLYLDPNGYYNNGVPESVPLHTQSAMISALTFLQTKGGTMMLHGYTHQYSNVPNPYTAVTGDDAEFYRITLNSDNTLNYQGPLPPDSASWAQGRFRSAGTELALSGFNTAKAGLPQLLTFPSYAASATDYYAAQASFGAYYGTNFTRSERALYFSGLLSGSTIDYTRLAGQYMPYTVRDIYGSRVLADTLGGIEPEPLTVNGTIIYPARLPADLIADAQRNLVVRDGVASFFYHPTDDISYLKATVSGLKSLGYTFVSPLSL
jgi:uncharacterized protein YdaL